MTDQDISLENSDGTQTQDLRLELNFVPEWARKPSNENYLSFSSDDDGSSRSKGKPARDRHGKRDRGSDRRGEPRSGGRQSRQPRNASPQPERHHSQHREPYREPPKVNVRFLPSPKAISEILKKLKASRQAHPLFQIAGIYLANPETCLARVEAAPGTPGLHIVQCRICGMIDLNEDSIRRHMVKEHLEQFMEKTEEQGEPPTGSFNCVAQCGLSGTLLGPPNHHSYGQKLREIHSQLFPNMSLERYQSSIRTIHDPELVEKWKQEFSRKTAYRLKDGENRESMPFLKAEAFFLQSIAPEHIARSRKAIIPVPLCRSIGDRSLQQVVKNAWIEENRFPISIMMALRGAFTNKGLVVFKAGKGRGHLFVSHIPLAPIGVEHVVDSIREVLLYLQQNPGSTRLKMIEDLRPGAEPESDLVAEILTPLSWLIERGHIIEFYNGTLSVPELKKEPVAG